MTRIVLIKLCIKPAVLALTLAISACGLQQGKAFAPSPSSELVHALALYQSGEVERADAMLTGVYNSPQASRADQKRALAALILIRLEESSSTALTEAETLLERYAQLSDGPIAPEFYLLRESLEQAIAATNSAHSQQGELKAVRRQLERAQYERRQLEETLRKLRKLSLE